MSFAVPRNVPSFSEPHRATEDQLWAASGSSWTDRQRASAGPWYGGRLASTFNEGTLPMYKDKPYANGRPGVRSVWLQWRSVRVVTIVVTLVVLGLYLLGHLLKKTSSPSTKEAMQTVPGLRDSVTWSERRNRVVEAFETSWDAYASNAWGMDEYHPVTKTGRHMSPTGLGWIIVDALDTMMLMNLTSRLVHARRWISTSLTWDQDQDVNTFETTIRILGGLLSAHYLSREHPDLATLSPDLRAETGGDDLYLEKARDLAHRLLVAFKSPSGIPYASVHLAQRKGIASHLDAGASSTAEATSLQLEFRYLAKLTGEREFWSKVERVMSIVAEKGPRDGLVPILIDPSTGYFISENIRLGSRGDSYYEYLLKQHLQTRGEEPRYGQMWSEALDGIRRHLLTYTKNFGFTIIGERPDGLSGRLHPKMDHLACFMPGTIALGATGGATEADARANTASDGWTLRQSEEMRLARELMLTCWGMYKATATGLAAEITYFQVSDPPPKWEPQRPVDIPSPPTELKSRPVALSESQVPVPKALWHDDYVIRPADRHNLQRPETVESLLYMWRITGDEHYREWGWEMFESFMKYTAVENSGGYSCLDNVNILPPVVKDDMESFWLAETLKYFYLLFSPNDLLPLDQVVFNTEAHPLPRFSTNLLFSTG